MKRTLLALFLLTGCVHSTTPAVKIPPPADLVSPCKTLSVFNGKDLKSVFVYTENLITDYKLCSAKQSALARVFR